MKRFLIVFIIFIFFGSLILFAALWYGGYPGATEDSMVTKVTIAEAIFAVDVADTPASREQGLSGRPRLADNEGMLFIFPESFVPAFWMKDMNFALDMIWIDGDRRVVDITEDALPESFPESFRPSEPVKYVLEINAHGAAENGIKIGDTVEFSN